MPLNLNDPRISPYKAERKGFLIVIEGESGIGKTTLLGGLIDHFGQDEVLFADIEEKLLPIADKHPLRWGEETIDHTSKVDEMIEYLHAAVKGNEARPRIAVLESFSEWSDLKLKEAKIMYPSREKSGSFDRFDMLGNGGLDLLVNFRSVPELIKIVTITSAQMPGQGWKYNLPGNMLPQNLARKVDILLHIGEYNFTDGQFKDHHPLKQYEGSSVRAIQTSNWGGIVCKNANTGLSVFEPTESEEGKRDGMAMLVQKVLDHQRGALRTSGKVAT